MESSENLLLGLPDEQEFSRLAEKCQNGEWHPTLGDLLILALYNLHYQSQLERFIEKLDLLKIQDDFFYEDFLDPKKHRTNKEKLIGIKNLIEEMRQRQQDNRIISFVKNGET